MRGRCPAAAAGSSTDAPSCKLWLAVADHAAPEEQRLQAAPPPRLRRLPDHGWLCLCPRRTLQDCAVVSRHHRLFAEGTAVRHRRAATCSRIRPGRGNPRTHAALEHALELQRGHRRLSMPMGATTCHCTTPRCSAMRRWQVTWSRTQHGTQRCHGMSSSCRSTRSARVRSKVGVAVVATRPTGVVGAPAVGRLHDCPEHVSATATGRRRRWATRRLGWTRAHTSLSAQASASPSLVRAAARLDPVHHAPCFRANCARWTLAPPRRGRCSLRPQRRGQRCRCQAHQSPAARCHLAP